MRIRFASLISIDEALKRCPVPRACSEAPWKVLPAPLAGSASAGDDEASLEVLAGCLGVYARHCSVDELRDLLRRGPLSPAGGGAEQQLRHALTLAAVAEHAPHR